MPGPLLDSHGKGRSRLGCDDPQVIALYQNEIRAWP
jgi:hypothetical protein